MNKLEEYCKLFIRKYKLIKKAKMKSLKIENKYLSIIYEKLIVLDISLRNIKIKKDDLLSKIKEKIENNNKIIYSNYKKMDITLLDISRKISPFVYNSDKYLDEYLNSIQCYLNNDQQIFEIHNQIYNINNLINEESIDEAIEELKLELMVSKIEPNKHLKLKEMSENIEILINHLTSLN